MVLVTVSEGTLEGQYVQNERAEFMSFKGIPYAAPPVGDLRFKVLNTKYYRIVTAFRDLT